MALISPGVEVTVTDTTALPASGPGTIPLIFIATAQDKLVPGSTSTIAEGTLKENSNKPYLLTSQSDALNFFGIPVFQEDSGTVLQGDELNEWGLHGLYSVLGVTNQAWAVRADIDLQEIEPTQVEPRNYPLNGTFWLDASITEWGLKEYDGSVWERQEVLVPALNEVQDGNDTSPLFPNDDFGGDPVTGSIYAVVPYVLDTTIVSAESLQTNPSEHRYFRKSAGESVWTDVTASITFQSLNAPSSPSTGDLWVKLDSPANGLDIQMKQFSGSTNSWTNLTTKAGTDLVELEAQWGALLSTGSIGFVANADSNGDVGTIKRKNASGPITASGIDLSLYDGASSPVGDITIRYSNSTLPFALTKIVISTIATTTYQDVIDAFNNDSDLSMVLTDLSVGSDGTAVEFKSIDGREFVVTESGTAFADVVPTSNWVNLRHFGQEVEPTRVAAEDSLWFDDSLYGDFMISDGQEWKSLGSYYETAPGAGDSDTTWVFSQNQPDMIASPTDINNADRLPILGDIWVDTNDGANLEFYVYTGVSWKLLDSSDQSTTDGMLFADLRQSDANGNGYLNTITSEAKELFRVGVASTDAESSIAFTGDYVDPDAPDPRFYPAGMICCNTRAFGGIVRKYVENPFEDISFTDATGGDSELNNFTVGATTYTMPSSVVDDSPSLAGENFSRARWITESGNALDGSGLFGRKAQRKIIVEKLAESILIDEIRSEFMEFNLAIAPGYVELLDELITLNVDRRETCYIITDVPARLEPTGTNINNWAQNANNAPSNGEIGRTSAYSYAAQYMGWCLGTNVDGTEVTIPGSSVALRTYVYSDSVSYVWFPPAGASRGIVTNAASVGYVNDEGDYTPVIYNQGQRDIMYTNNINPIAMRPNRGLLVFGDKSLSPTTGALDRVNVGRLIVHLRTEIEKIAERFLFQLNTSRVREEAAGAINAFLSDIVQKEGIFDYSVVADSSNNTPTRIDRNELWIDIAIQPTKSINFVFVPIRIQNTQ